MEEQKLSRKELYDLVWSVSLLTLSKKYLISDNELRKACIRMNIPLPPSGYWTKLKFNKTVEIKEFPEKLDGENELVLRIRKEGENLLKTTLSTLSTLQQSIILEEGNKLKVPERLTNPCDLIVVANDALKDAHVFRSQLVRSFNCKLNIEVSKNQIGRALRFMDTFIKVMISRGHKFTYNKKLSYVVIQGEEIRIRCSEKVNKTLKPNINSYEKFDYTPTGILFFAVVVKWNNIVWKDGKLPIEEQLANIIAKLELKGEELKQESIKRKIAKEEKNVIENIKKQELICKQKEADNFKMLLIESKRWQEAELIRKYIDKKEAYSKANNAYTKEIEEEILWAREKADWYDPLIATNDNILGFFEKSDFQLQSNKVR